uniref:Putative tpa exp: thiol-disulfide isomerase and thioredoxin n=1 Tax=Ixodes ricinus TaxID=34613 RepID=A0A0K8RCT8_IXORI
MLLKITSWDYWRTKLRNSKLATSTLTLRRKKPGLVAYLSSKEHTFYDTFRKVASDLRDDCNFYFVPRPVLDGNITHTEAIHFKPSRTKFGDNHETLQQHCGHF